MHDSSLTIDPLVNMELRRTHSFVGTIGWNINYEVKLVNMRGNVNFLEIQLRKGLEILHCDKKR